MWKQIGALLLCSAATVRGVPVLPADTRLDPAASASSSNLEVRNAALEAKLEGAKEKADLEVKLAKAEAEHGEGRGRDEARGVRGEERGVRVEDARDEGGGEARPPRVEARRPGGSCREPSFCVVQS